MTPRRLALVALATAGLIVFAGILLSGNGDSGSVDHALIRPAGAFVISLFAASCAAGAAWAARGGQRFAWIALAVGLGGQTAGDAMWCYVRLGGQAPISTSSVAELGYVVLPLCALAAAVLVPSRDDSRFGFSLLVDGVLVASTFVSVIGALLTGRAAHTVSFPRIVLVASTTFYLGLTVMTLIVAGKAEAGRRLSPGLLAAGFAVTETAGVMRLSGNTSDQIVLGWISGTYLVALSAIASRPGPDLDTRPPQPWSRLSMWLPYLPLSVGLVVGSVHLWPAERDNVFVFSVGLVVVFAALTRHFLALDRKQRLLAALSDAARRDTVTGLANRRLLSERLTHAVRLHHRQGVPVSVISISVDDFNVVSDTLGYAAGEELLRTVGERIHPSIRAGDTVARMGGDEFAILVEDSPEVAVQVAERLARSFDSPVHISDHRVFVHLSIGVASAGSDQHAATTAGALLDQAGAARYRAEQTNATDVRTFAPEMDVQFGRRQAFHDGIHRLQLLGDLRRAIDDNLLTLVYQPQFSMSTGSVCGAEALLRWEHPTLGAMEPGEFLPLVREHGLMDAVTDLVLSRAVAEASRWHADGTAIPVAVNLWARSLDEDTLPERIMSVLNAHGMSASSLTVEITEELVVADFGKGRAVLNRLRDAGIRVAIDDFGSGYSTLTYLRELPIDDVKLDHQLIAPILYDKRAATITRSVIELAEEFGIASIAEGVENEETAQRLKEFGCDAVQGNFFCVPLPAGEVPQVPADLTLMAH